MHKSLSNKQILGRRRGVGVCCLTALRNFYKTKLDRYDFNEYQMQCNLNPLKVVYSQNDWIIDCECDLSRKSVALFQSSKGCWNQVMDFVRKWQSSFVPISLIIKDFSRLLLLQNVCQFFKTSLAFLFENSLSCLEENGQLSKAYRKLPIQHFWEKYFPIKNLFADEKSFLDKKSAGLYFAKPKSKANMQKPKKHVRTQFSGLSKTWN